MREIHTMDKHYGWQEGRGSQPSQGRFQNGQRWNERQRDDDRDMRGGRGSDYGWEQDEGRYGGREQRWGSQGDFEREEYVNEGELYGGSRSSRFDQWSPRSAADQGQWSQGGYNRSREFGGRPSGAPLNRGQGGQNFSGGHYGGFANEGYPDQASYGRGFGSRGQAQAGQRFGSQGSAQNWGQTFGQGYASGQGRGFHGRGPKGYQRSDERIKEQVSDRLMDDDDIDATEITVEVKSGEVTLTGTVNTREEKRAAEDAAERTPGVRDVQNHLRVQWQESPSGRPQSGSPQSKTRSTERE
jgi:osmotically-inducible protein OsmY